MPLIQATIIEGRSMDDKHEFCRRVAAAAVDTLGVTLPQVRVILNEVPADHWTVGGVSKTELDARKALNK